MKQKILQSESFIVRIFFAFVLLFLEIAFAIASLPLYFFASPDTFERQVSDTSGVQSYSFRRKVGLGTILGAGGMYAAKVLVVTAISFFLIGAPTLLADTQTWTFATPSDYTYDNAKIEITGGAAQMKNIGVPATGATTNSGFDSGSTGWTYADWLQPAGSTATGVYVASAGNPGGYVNNRLQTNNNKNKIVATYWRQPFTTTVASPDTATLNLDWKSLTFTAPQTLVSYKLYAFIDTASGIPTVGQEVWSSPEITSTTNWASISAVDIKSKVPTAGTYYLKIGARVASNTGTNATNDLITGFDNVAVNWSKSNTSYDTSIPSLAPTTSLNPAKVLSWSSFTETATKGGELYYQLSNDDGVTWKYWNGSTLTWSTAGASNYTTAATVNTNISSFPRTNNKIRWKAFFSSNGTQQNVLNNIAIGYTQNTTPSLTGLSPAQQSSTGRVNIGYTLVDTESDTINLPTYEYSTNGTSWSTMTAATGDPAHSGVTGLTSSPGGVAHTFVWNAFADLGAISSSSVQVRLRPNDGITNGTLVTSSTFAVDYVIPVVSNVSASESTGSTNVIVTYDLSDASASGLFVELEASADGGSNWTVPTTSATGAVGSGVTAGTGKTITWNAGTNYSGHQLDTMKVRVRAKDTYQNQGTFVNSSTFSLDTLAPAVLAGADLQSQPHAGESAVTVSGTFTEANPNTNLFYVALGSGVYGSSTAGSSGTSTPPAQAVTTAVLKGNDVITKAKVVHTDTHGLSTTNENTSPAVAYKYVKPYTPLAPTVTSPGAAALDVVVNKNTSEVTGLEYAIYETSTNQYVQANSTLGASAVWQTTAVWSTVHLTSLPSPLANYSFETKSRNTNDGAHAPTSESALSSAASIANTAPSIALASITQPAGTSYIRISYTGTDAQGDTSSLVTYQYSTNGSTWNNMTEKSGVGSNGKTGIAFSPAGASLIYAWDAATDLPGVEIDTVSIRLQANDGLINGNTATSSTFMVDTLGPVVSNVSATQPAGSTNVTISYDLAEQSSTGINVTLEVSNNSGSSWVVPSSSATGAVGSGVSAGTGKTITWNAGTDYSGHQLSTMQVRVRGRDMYLNQGSFLPSSDFSLDTLAPAVLAGADLNSQPHAGDTSATVSGTFTEINPSTNQFYVALNGGAYGSATAGASGTATPSPQAVTTTALTGSDYITKVKVVHTDTYGQSGTNENTSPTAAYKYVKPYTPPSPTVTTPGSGALNISVNKHASEAAGLSYAIYDTSTSKYVQADNTLGTSAVWQTIAVWSTVHLTNLPNPIGSYAFETKSRNSQDGAHAVSSESDLSSAASVGNTAPSVALGSISQPTGASYVEIHYTGTDAQGDAATLLTTEYSTNGSTWNTMTEKSGVGSNGKTGLGFTPSGASLMFAWDAAMDVPGVEINTVSIRVQAHDGIVNGNMATSSTFAVDTRGPVVTNVTAAQGLHSTLVAITYDLADQSSTGLNVTLEISSNSGSNWIVPSASATGAVGSGVGAGTGKTISWNAGTDYSGHQLSTMQVRVRAKDTYENQGSFLASSDFGLDTVAPTVLAGANVDSQPSAGDTSITVSGTFTEANPDTNQFYVALGSGVYGSATAGSSGTATPSPQAVTTAALNGSDYITKAKVVHTDAYGQSVTNENTSPTVAYAYVKPYTPPSPTVTSPGAGALNVTVNKHASEVTGLEYAIYETSTGKHVQADNTLGTSAVWQTIAAWSTVHLTSLPNPLVNYSFETKSRNNNDGTHAPTSESALSSAASIANTAPSITLGVIERPTGTSYVRIAYTGTDAQHDTSSLVAYEYSTNGSTWNTMTEKSGVGSNGKTGLAFTASGASLIFAWNIATDLPNTESGTVSIRLRANDGTIDGNTATSSEFTVDTRAPVVSNVSAVETAGTTNVAITYDLSDISTSGLLVELEISSNSGSNWVVPNTSTTGAVGSGVSAGTGKTITWNAGADYSGHQLSTMQVRVRAKDTYENQGVFANSTDFGLDTVAPTVLTGANLDSQPHAGDTTVTISGTFTEVNPGTNQFYVALGSGVYSSATNGASGTATPSAQATDTGTTLAGDDYISKVKVVHTDAYGQSVNNENTSPTTSYVYVKPYTPLAPTVVASGPTSLSVTINKHLSEVDGLSYAMYETSTHQYVQADNTLGVSAVWQPIAVWSTITVAGLPNPLENYSFETKSRNTNDGLHASTSESNLSSAASVGNTAPSIILGTIEQPVGTSYISVAYTGTDAQGDTSSLVTAEYSADGFTWHPMTEKSGVGSNGKTGLSFSPSGRSLMFAWDAAMDLAGTELTGALIRLQPNDGTISGSTMTSAGFPVDTKGPVVSHVSASQSVGSTLFTITYDLVDQTSSGMNVTMEVSSDGGSNWTVPTTSATGAVGSGVGAGTGKTIIWNASADHLGNQSSTMQVHIRAKDAYENQGSFVNSSNFSLDTLAPSVLVGANLTSQPHAGDTTATISGTFTEVNPGTNQFYIALGSGVYGSVTDGASGTATPSAQATATGTMLNGSDVITKVKVIHIDTYGQLIENENTSPTTAYAYVKPYTPAAPTVTTPAAESLSITINKHPSEVDNLEYAIYETSTGQYVQADSTLGGTTIWQTMSAWSTVSITGLLNPLENYSFQTKSRNPIDGSHAVTSESDFSPVASISNTAPTVALGVIEQPVGMSYVRIAYTGTDPESNSTSLAAADYSTDGSTWVAMTEKSGVGSNGRTGLSFSPSGTSLMFAWNIATDLPGAELSNVYIRLKANDGVIDGNTATSSSFSIDTRAPVVNTISASQNAGSGLVTISYNLVDQTSSALNVALEISDDNGSSWTVPQASATGAVGAAVTTGVGKTITWNAGTDYANHYTSSMLVRLTATDSFANAATPVHSSVFTIDTKTPIIATLSASQIATNDQVTITYDLSDDTATGLTVAIETSPDGGTTWTAATALSGNAGGGQSAGTSKLATWNASTDLSNIETSHMVVRVKASDAFGNQNTFLESSPFVLDTASPVGPTAFSAPTTTETSATFSWSSGVTDAHFSYYEIWYGASAGDVNCRCGTAQKWSVTQDPTLSAPATHATIITGLTSGGTYVAKIWAVDTFGHQTSPSDITITLPSPPVVVPPSTGGGTGSSVISAALTKPILNPPPAFTRQATFDVSGRAETLSRVDIYDNQIFLKSTQTSSTGTFQESFTFQEGGHSLTAKTIDQQSATSDFSDPVTFTVDLTPPRAPEITSPTPDQSFAPGEILVTGSAELSSTVDITLDDTATFFATTGTDGLWSAKIPTTSAQTLGTHRLSVTSLDRAGNTSPAANLTIRRVQTAPPLPTEVITIPVTTPVTTPTVTPVTPIIPAPVVPSPVAAPVGGVTPTPAPGITPTTPTPAVTPIAPAPAVPSLPVTPAVAQNVLEAVELPALPVPQILSVRAESLSVATGTVAGGVTPAAPEDLLRFSGNAIPNQDVMVYIHSDQALVYRVKADHAGMWTLDHSQTALELTPGEHTIYAVSVNPDAQIKSPPSPIHRFTVTRNFWSMMYRRLDIYSTSLTILALLSMMAWLYQIQQKRRVA